MNKIIFFAYSDGVGLTFHLTMLCLCLKKADVPLVVVHNGLEQNPGLLQKIESSGVESLNINQTPIEEYIDSHVDDLIGCVFHCQGFRQIDRIKKYKKKLKCKVVITVNAYRNGSACRHFYSLLIQLKYRGLVDRWVFLSEFSATSFSKYFNCCVNKDLIHLGVDFLSENPDLTPPEKLHDVISKSFIEVDANRKYVFYLAQFYKHKRHALLIKIFSDLQKKFPDVRLVLMGDGKLMGDMAELCSSLGVREKVYFLGRINRFQVGNYLRLAYLSVVLSKNETFGHTIVEPLALGVPVFSPMVGVAGDAIVHLENGYILSNTKHNYILQSISSFISGSIELKGSLSDKFSWNNVSARYVNLYKLLSVH